MAQLTRRKFFRITAGAAGVAVISACAVPAPQVVESPAPVEEVVEKPAAEEAAAAPEAPAQPAAVPSDKEAPMLAERVRAGQLPPLEERIPANPLMVKPGMLVLEEELPELLPGVYGGSFKYGRVGGFDGMAFLGCCEPLVAGPSLTLTP